MPSGSREQRFGRLVELIYDSIQDMSQIAPVMALMCDELDAIVGHYMHMDIERREVLASCVSSAEYQAGDFEYKEYYCMVDDRLDWLASGQVGEWRADHQRFDERFVRNSEIYNDFLFKYGGRHMVVGRIGESAGRSEAISLLRPVGAQEYSAAEYHFLQRLTPHLTRSASLRANLQAMERQQSASEAMLASFSYGTVWVNAASRIISMNQAATDILAEADGLLTVNARLSAHQPADAERLDVALRAATGMLRREGQWLALARRKRSMPLLVSVIPATIPAALDPLCGGPFALVILQDMARQKRPPAGQLQSAYRLTAAETRLAEALLENETIDSYAGKAGVSRNTVRTHLASLFAKTGTRRQAELLRILLASQPHIAP